MIKDPKYVDDRPVYLKKSKWCISGDDNYISSWCSKNANEKSFANKNGPIMLPTKVIKELFIWQILSMLNIFTY